MSDQRIKIVELLASKTNASRLNWVESVDEDAFQLDVGKNTIIVTAETGDRGTDIRIKIYSEDGRLVESFSDEDLPADRLLGSSWYSVMSELHQSARRSALGADKVMNDVISGLVDK